MTIYDVYPGICLVYNDVRIPHCTVEIDRTVVNVIEIAHCRRGRIECRDGEYYFYLTQGDISIRKKCGADRRLEFPLSHFDTSPTNLKSSFRGVYGISIQSYQREQKMRGAARLLLTTNMSIQEVAGELGYANSSKFSAAFYSDYICAFKNGKIVKFGTVEEVITQETLSDIYRVDFEIQTIHGRPLTIYY